jgi:ATP-binding cassette subfamily B (MDR/TAP) protein 7
MSFLIGSHGARLSLRPIIGCGAIAGPSRPKPSIPFRTASFLSTQARLPKTIPLIPRHVSHLSSTTTRSSPPSSAPPPTQPPHPEPESHSPTPTNLSIDPSKPTPKTSETSQAKTDWRIILKLAENIWPANSPATKVRVLGALGLLVAGKVLNVQVPFFFKGIVDGLNVPITEASTVYLLAGTAILGCESVHEATLCRGSC